MNRPKQSPSRADAASRWARLALAMALATVGFVAGFMWVSGARSASGIAAAAVLGTVGLLYLFVKAV